MPNNSKRCPKCGGPSHAVGAYTDKWTRQCDLCAHLWFIPPKDRKGAK